MRRHMFLALDLAWLPTHGPMGAATAAVLAHTAGAVGNLALAAWPSGKRRMAGA
jgi:hypothetical protein